MPFTLWVISGVYYPEEAASGFLMTRIAEGLARRFPVRALCAQPTYTARGTRAPARETHNGVEIERCPSTALNQDVLLFKLINFVTISLSLFFRTCLRIQRGDVVLVVTSPPLLPVLVFVACRLRGAKGVLISHDVYPDVLTVAGLARSRSLPFRVLDWLNRWIYRSMDRIVVIGRDMQRLVAEKMKAAGRNGSTPHEIVLIPNWADLDLVRPMPRQENPLLRELGLSDKFVIQYAGNMGLPHALEDVLESAVRLKRCHPDVHFLFIGGGAKRKWLEEAVREKGLDNVTILPHRPRCDQPNFLNACDLAIVPFVPGMTGLGVPSRLYNILAAGKPIIAVAEDGSELAEVVREEEAGWVIPPGNPDQIVEVIGKAQANPEERISRGARARAAAERKYSFEHAIAAYEEMIREILGTAPARQPAPVPAAREGRVGGEEPR